MTGGSYGSGSDAARHVPGRLFVGEGWSYWLPPTELEEYKQRLGQTDNSRRPMHRNALSANCHEARRPSQITSEIYCTR